MENSIYQHRISVRENIEKAFNGGVNLNEELEKARSGVYADTAENRKLARVGQQYGGKKKKEFVDRKSNILLVSTATYIYAKDKNGDLYVLAGRRGSTAPTGANKMNPAMGMIDFGESPSESAVREIKEETGLNIKRSQLKDLGDEEYGNRKGIGGRNYSVMLSGNTSDYKVGNGDGENSKFNWVKVSSIKDDDWAFGTGNAAVKFSKK